MAIAFDGLKHNRACAVAEKDRGIAVVLIGDFGERFGANQENPFEAHGDKPMCLHKSIDKAGACSVDVACTAIDLKFFLDLRCGGGNLIIGGGRCEKDEINVGASEVCHVECFASGFNGKAGGGATVTTFANSGSFGDPRIGGVETRFEISVGDDDVGERGAPTSDGCATRGRNSHRFLGVRVITRYATKQWAGWW
ncbi:unannotated protein [freshwater metagenome]|uniref:Unannotated protein n=1 Tax=freshwater metagenome TaxID=449393 RepID=A0A6J6DSW0_9ZZZZ